MIKEGLKLAITRYLHFLETGVGSVDADVLKLEDYLDQFSHLRHGLVFSFDPGETHEPKEDFETGLRELITKRFPEFSYYNTAEVVTSSIGESGVVVGDPIEDIIEITCDLKETLWRWEKNSVDDALWFFDFSFESHWGRHLRDLQVYLWNIRQGL